MHLIVSKVIFAASIFMLSLVSGLASLKIYRQGSQLSIISDAISSGIFLGAALLHMLPDAVTKFGELSNHEYPIAYLICLITFVILLFLERGLSTYGNNLRKTGKTVIPTFLVGLLAAHSIVEGAAIGANSSLLGAMAIFIAVFAHKGSESFALTINLQRLAIAKNTIKKTIVVFSMTTPLGILIASYILAITDTNSGGITLAIFNSIAAGTFLYLSTEHLIEGEKSFGNLHEVIALILGVGLMALVAVFV